MKLVYVCSPYRGDVERNTEKAQRYCRFVYTQRAIPIAVHLHNTRFLDDEIPEERQAGLLLGLHMLKRCDSIWVFGDRISEGMMAEIKVAKGLNLQIEYFNEKCERRRVYEYEQF